MPTCNLVPFAKSLLPTWIIGAVPGNCLGKNGKLRYINNGHCAGIKVKSPWWRHQMETFSALLAICAGNSPVPGEFPAQRPVTRSFDVYFDLRPNKRLSKQL